MLIDFYLKQIQTKWELNFFITKQVWDCNLMMENFAREWMNADEKKTHFK